VLALAPSSPKKPDATQPPVAKSPSAAAGKMIAEINHWWPPLHAAAPSDHGAALGGMEYTHLLMSKWEGAMHAAAPSDYGAVLCSTSTNVNMLTHTVM